MSTALYRDRQTSAFRGMPPTVRKVQKTGIDIMRFEYGQAVERRGAEDRLAMLSKHGIIPRLEQERGPPMKQEVEGLPLHRRQPTPEESGSF